MGTSNTTYCRAYDRIDKALLNCPLIPFSFLKLCMTFLKKTKQISDFLWLKL